MSGGVDSLRTAALLKHSGHDVFGLHMRLPSVGSDPGSATYDTGPEKLERVQRLAEQLAIPLFVSDLRAEFEALVVEPFLEAYRSGFTPNPCVLCNARIKFGHLLRESERLGAERLATGHYVHSRSPARANGRWSLLRGADPGKDQSYFLYRLSQRQLAKVLFPLGPYTKSSTHRWARETGLASLLGEESQEICFIPSGNYRQLLRRRGRWASSPVPGPIKHLNGTVLGQHRGIFNYTVGQRRGLGIASSAPYYVVRLEPETNTVRVGRVEDLYCSRFRVDELNWVSVPAPQQPLPAQVRIRHQHAPADALITPVSEASAEIIFTKPQRAVTPGQSAVFYRGDLVLGGGTISRPV